MKGQVQLPPLKDLSVCDEKFWLLFQKKLPESAQFFDKIRAYNSSLAFTSVGVSED